MARGVPDEPPTSTPASNLRRTTGPRAGSPWESKKRRKVNTCTECRRRKLQCDQATPTCGRCVRAIHAGQPAVCRYIEEGTSSTSFQSPTPAALPVAETPQHLEPPSRTDSASVPSDVCDAVDSKLERQNRRIEELERALYQLGQNLGLAGQNQSLPLTPESCSCQPPTQAVAVTSDAQHDAESTLLKGSSFKTRFYGLSFPESIMAYTPKLGDLSKEIVVKFPILVKVRQELRDYEARSNKSRPSHQSSVQTDLLALLPPQSETTTLVQLYLDNYDNIYHILHVPSFRSSYANMWLDLPNSDPYFVAVVLLMVAIAQCLQNNAVRQYHAKRSAPRDAAIHIIQACEEWLAAQRQKPVSIHDFQIPFLICLAKTVNGTKFKKAWVDIGMLLRFCMAAGLHKDPETLSNKSKPTSALDKEMRRRIWFAVAELELQTSFTRGMMSAPWLSCSNCTIPGSISDDEFSRESTTRPPSSGLDEFCETSYLVAANASFPLRYSLNSVLNDVRQTVTFDMAKYYTEQIEQHLEKIPPWNHNGAIAPAGLLRLSLCNYMLVLHDRHLRQATSEVERKFSKLVIVDTVTRIAGVHESLLAADCHAIQLLCQDHLRPILSVCHALTGTRPCPGSKIDQTLVETAIGIAKCTVELLLERVERLGGGQQQLWIALVSNALIKSESYPVEKALHMQEAVDKMIGSYYKILACQDSQNFSAAGASNLAPSVSAMEDALSNAQRLTPFNVDGMSAWTFDEWSFDLPGALDFNTDD